jgi:hypothetical protein
MRAAKARHGPGSWSLWLAHEDPWRHTLGERATSRIELDRDDDGDSEELIAAEAPSDAKSSFSWSSLDRGQVRPASASRGRTSFQSPTQAM